MRRAERRARYAADGRARGLKDRKRHRRSFRDRVVRSDLGPRKRVDTHSPTRRPRTGRGHGIDLSGLRPQTSTVVEPSLLVRYPGSPRRMAYGLRLRVSAGLAPASLSSQACVMHGLYTERASANKAPGAPPAGRSEVPCYAPSVTRPRASAPGILPASSFRFADTVALLVAGCGSAQGTSAPPASAGPDAPAASSRRLGLDGPRLARSRQSGHRIRGPIRCADGPGRDEPIGRCRAGGRLHRHRGEPDVLRVRRGGRRLDGVLPRAAERLVRGNRPVPPGRRGPDGHRLPRAGRRALLAG